MKKVLATIGVAAATLCLAAASGFAAQGHIGGGNSFGGGGSSFRGGGSTFGGGGGSFRGAPVLTVPRATFRSSGPIRHAAPATHFVPNTASRVHHAYNNPGPWKGIDHHHGHDEHGHHQHHHRHFVVYAPYYDYYNDYNDYAYGSGCGWLWQRYLATGNLKWKYRYHECIE